MGGEAGARGCGPSLGGDRITEIEVGAEGEGGVADGASFRGGWASVLASLAGVGVVALAAQVAWAIPGTTVPQSGQTLAVLLVGAVLGERVGALSLVLYVLLGAFGLPVLADGASGWGHVVGPTAGYLVGFIVAAGLVGRAADRGRLKPLGQALGVMLLGHVAILGLGWFRLSWVVGPAEAFAGGVVPFLWGGVVKSGVAACLAFAALRMAAAAPSTRQPLT